MLFFELFAGVSEYFGVVFSLLLKESGLDGALVLVGFVAD